MNSFHVGVIHDAQNKHTQCVTAHHAPSDITQNVSLFVDLFFYSCGHAVFKVDIDYSIVISVRMQINVSHFFYPPDIGWVHYFPERHVIGDI